MLPTDNIHLVPWVVQHILDRAQLLIAAEYFHSNQLCRKNDLIGNILPVELHRLAAHGLGSFHGVNSIDLQQITGFLHTAGCNFILLAVDPAAVKVTQILWGIQPAQHLHLPVDAMGGNDLSRIDILEFHIKQLLCHKRTKMRDENRHA